MPQKRWLAIVTWVDGDVIDADEIAVFAESIDRAEFVARRTWSATNRAHHPHCRIEEVQIFDYGRLRTLAES